MPNDVRFEHEKNMVKSALHIYNKNKQIRMTQGLKNRNSVGTNKDSLNEDQEVFLEIRTKKRSKTKSKPKHKCKSKEKYKPPKANLQKERDLGAKPINMKTK